jgi:hypothetical protein
LIQQVMCARWPGTVHLPGHGKAGREAAGRFITISPVYLRNWTRIVDRMTAPHMRSPISHESHTQQDLLRLARWGYESKNS